MRTSLWIAALSAIVLVTSCLEHATSVRADDKAAPVTSRSEYTKLKKECYDLQKNTSLTELQKDKAYKDLVTKYDGHVTTVEIVVTDVRALPNGTIVVDGKRDGLKAELEGTPVQLVFEKPDKKTTERLERAAKGDKLRVSATITMRKRTPASPTVSFGADLTSPVLLD